MKRRAFRAVLTDLARQDPDDFMKPDGTVNATRMAAAIGVTQASISRALSNPNYQPKPKTIDGICKVFGVSAAQARGEDTLVAPPDESRRLSPRTQSFAQRFEALPAARKKILEAMLTELESLSAQAQAG